MAIDIVPYGEPISHPLERGWRGWFQSVWDALRGWKSSDYVITNNPISGTNCPPFSVTSVTTTPYFGIEAGDCILIQPSYTPSIGTLIMTCTVLSTGQIRWDAHNYGASSILLNSSNAGNLILLIFRRKK